MEILTFFQKEIYKHLQIPISRIDTTTQFSDGTDITRDELKFAQFIERLQKTYADAIKRAFIIHLKLKNKKLNLFESMNFNKDVFWEQWDNIQQTFDAQRKIALTQKKNQLKNISLQLEELKVRKNTTINESAGDELRIMLLENEIEQLLEDAKVIKSEVDEINKSSKSLWESFEIKEEDLMVRFNLGSSFQALRSQQKFQINVDNLSNLSQNPLVSFTYLLKTIMGWSDEQILANNAWRKLDAEHTWEIASIEQSGPDFRNVANQEGGGGLEGGGGGPGGPGLGGGGGAPGPSGDDAKLANLQNPEAGGAPGPEGGAPEGNAPEAGGAPEGPQK